MSKLFYLVIFFSALNLSAQKEDDKCDCIVVFGYLNDPTFKVQKEAEPFLPKKGKKIAVHEVIKDSAAWWFIKPHVYDSLSNGSAIKVMKKNLHISSKIVFNGEDSIPLFSEPNKNSKIIEYLPKEGIKSKTLGDFREHFWFMGCKNGYVKIMAKQSGWIRKENYVHFDKGKKG